MRVDDKPDFWAIVILPQTEGNAPRRAGALRGRCER